MLKVLGLKLSHACFVSSIALKEEAPSPLVFGNSTFLSLHSDMGLQDSDRLDSDFLNPLPSNLAAQLEAHKNPEGELVSVPSDLARQIEDHRKETKARPHTSYH